MLCVVRRLRDKFPCSFATWNINTARKNRNCNMETSGNVVGVQALTAVIMKSPLTFRRNISPPSSGSGSQARENLSFPHCWFLPRLPDSEDEGSTFFRNVDVLLPDNMPLHLRR
jgi:hypothetical protein